VYDHLTCAANYFSQQTTTRQAIQKKQTQSEPTHNAGPKNNGAVKEDKKQERVPNDNQRPGSSAVDVESAPPPKDVYEPAGEKRVIDVKPAAPVEAEHFSGLAGGVAIGRSPTPSVIKM